MEEANERENKCGRFSIIPSRAVDDKSLSRGALLVLTALGTYGDKNGWCWPSQTTIADRIKLSRRSIQDYLNELISKNYIGKRRRFRKDGGETSCMYKILFDTEEPAPPAGPEPTPPAGPEPAPPAGPEPARTFHMNAPQERCKNDFSKDNQEPTTPLPTKRNNGLEHISISTEAVIEKMRQLPTRPELSLNCQKCDGAGAMVEHKFGRIYEYVCGCQAEAE